MAIEHISAVLNAATGLEPAQKLVLVILAEYARKRSTLTWPSAYSVARMAEIHPRYCRRLLADLISADWLAIHRKGGGPHKTTQYRLNMERLNSVRESTDNSGAESTDNSGAESTVSTPLTVLYDPANSALRRSNSALQSTRAVIDSTVIDTKNRTPPQTGARHLSKADRINALEKIQALKDQINGKHKTIGATPAKPPPTGPRSVADVLSEVIPPTVLLADSDRAQLESRKAEMRAQVDALSAQRAQAQNELTVSSIAKTGRAPSLRSVKPPAGKPAPK